MRNNRPPPNVAAIRRSLIRLLTESEKATLARRGDPITIESIADFIHEDALRVLRGANTPAPQSLHSTLDAAPDSFWERLRGLPVDDQLRRMKARTL